MVKPLLNRLGSLLAIVSLLFIGLIFWNKRQEIAQLEITALLIAAFLFSVVVYGLAGFLLSQAWCLLLRRISGKRIPGGWCHGVYGRTQIGKYIPGNIFQFAGRQVVGRTKELSQLTLLAATLFEIILLVAASSILTFTGLILMGINSPTIPVPVICAAAAAIVCVFLVLLVAIPWIVRWRQLEFPLTRPGTIVKALGPSFGLHLVFFLAAGAVLTGLVVVIEPSTPSTHLISHLIVIYAYSWIGGYITPGAPGGIGVREAILVLSLTPIIGESQSIIVALLFRLSTIFGDILFFLVTLKFSPVIERSTTDAQVES